MRPEVWGCTVRDGASGSTFRGFTAEEVGFKVSGFRVVRSGTCNRA